MKCLNCSCWTADSHNKNEGVCSLGIRARTNFNFCCHGFMLNPNLRAIHTSDFAGELCGWGIHPRTSDQGQGDEVTSLEDYIAKVHAIMVRGFARELLGLGTVALPKPDPADRTTACGGCHNNKKNQRRKMFYGRVRYPSSKHF